MINHVTFPGLGIELTLNRVAFTLFGMPIYWYGILIATGLTLALIFAFHYSRSFGIDADRMVDVILIGTVCAVIGGRVFYVATAPFEYESLREMIDIRLGGLAIYGAVIGAFLSGIVTCRWRKVPILPMFDLAGIGFLLGQGIGRWGNFVNQEAFGTNTTMPWGMYSEGTHDYLARTQEVLAAQGIMVDPGMPVHPTFLYESVWCLLGFFLLWAYMKHRKFDGELILMYAMWYGAERFVVEGMRTDSLMIGKFRISQVIAAVSVLIAFCLWVYLRRKYRGVPQKVHYTAIVKENGTAKAYEFEWLLGEKPMNDQQIKEEIERRRAAEQQETAEPETKPETAETEPEQSTAPETAESEPEENEQKPQPDETAGDAPASEETAKAEETAETEKNEETETEPEK